MLKLSRIQTNSKELDMSIVWDWTLRQQMLEVGVALRLTLTFKAAVMCPLGGELVLVVAGGGEVMDCA